MVKFSSQDKSALIRLASSLPKGSPERRTILSSIILTLRTAEEEMNVPGKHILGNAEVYKSQITGNAQVSGDAKVTISFISENAKVYGKAKVGERAKVSGKAQVYENAMVDGVGVVITGNAKVYGKAWVYEYAQVYGNAHVYGEAHMWDESKVYGKAKLFGNAEMYDKASLFGEAQVSGKAVLDGKAKVSGDAVITGTAKIGGTAVIKGGTWTKGKVISGEWSAPGVPLTGTKKQANKKLVIEGLDPKLQAKLDNLAQDISKKVKSQAMFTPHADIKFTSSPTKYEETEQDDNGVGIGYGLIGSILPKLSSGEKAIITKALKGQQIDLTDTRALKSTFTECVTDADGWAWEDTSQSFGFLWDMCGGNAVDALSLSVYATKNPGPEPE